MSSEQLTRIEDKVDKLSDDIRKYAERTARAESEIGWIKKAGSFLITIFLTACGWFLTNHKQ